MTKYWTRANHEDGTVSDNNARSSADARKQARAGSKLLRGSVDAMCGATVLDTYRDGEEIESPSIEELRRKGYTA